MKKAFIKSLLCTLMALVLVAGSAMSVAVWTAPVVTAEAKTIRTTKSICKEAYQKFLNKHIKKIDLFLVHDMNQDSVPDLVVQSGKYVKIYTLKNDKVTKVLSKKMKGDNAGSLIYASSTKQQFSICMCSDTSFTRIAYNTNYKVLETVYSDFSSSEVIFKVDGKKVSEAKYNGALNDTFNSDMYNTYYDYSICTKSNIENMAI